MIIFQSVKFKNFGSFGNYFTEIDLNSNDMSLVSGPNGHGKSYALLDSITFALFGKPFRKINIPQLVNTMNNKGCLVELNFQIGEESYKVIRGLKPKKFEIYKNDQLIEQSAKAKDYQKLLEEQILKMNYKSFTQIVTLGSSSFIPFMQLSPADRREVIEDILDIKIFSEMNFVIKAKLSMIKAKIQECKNKISVTEEKISLQEMTIKDLNSKRKQSLSDMSDKIDESKNQILLLSEEIESMETKIDSFELSAEKKNKAEKKLRKLENTIVSLIKDKKKLESTIEFYSSNEACSVCKQKISDEFKESQKSSLGEEKTKTEGDIQNLKNDYAEVKESIVDLNSEIQDMLSIKTKINEKINSIEATKKYIQSIESASSSQTSFESSIVECESNKTKFENEILDLNSSLSRLNKDKSNLDILFMLLKDSGIKSKIIKNYLPVINEIINRYLSEMNFFVSFSLDDEFNEEIKSRHRDTFSYMNFSEGEKSRIDLSILLAWREIAKLKNSACCNILILDEIFDSSLDSVGVDDLMKVLRELSRDSKIFVITHKSDQLTDKFDRTLTFRKKNNFSRLMK